MHFNEIADAKLAKPFCFKIKMPYKIKEVSFYWTRYLKMLNVILYAMTKNVFFSNILLIQFSY